MAMYNDLVMEHFFHPHNVGEIEDADGSGEYGSPVCGDLMKFTIKVDENDIITDAKFLTFGCGSAIASSSMATDMIIGKSVDEALEITNRKIVEELGGLPASEWQQAIDQAIKDGDSLGAVVECQVSNIDPGYGEPFWDSVESQIAHAVFAIPGVRAIEFGDGFAAAAMKGSEHNDPIGPDGRPLKNGAGGVNGGITNGAPLKFRVAFKPTASIRKAQQTFNFATGQMDSLEVPGRHDVCFALRAPVVVEAMTAIVLADLASLNN
jgi:chorismate synthase